MNQEQKKYLVKRLQETKQAKYKELTKVLDTQRVEAEKAYYADRLAKFKAKDFIVDSNAQGLCTSAIRFGLPDMPDYRAKALKVQTELNNEFYKIIDRVYLDDATCLEQLEAIINKDFSYLLD